MAINKKISLCLVHWPVTNKNGLRVSSAVTNMDIHDLARLSRTYGLKSFLIVTPDERQKDIVRKILGHWEDGFGAVYNAHRREALKTLRLLDSVEAVMEVISNGRKKPLLVSTSASKMPGSIGFAELRKVIRRRAEADFVLLFGTGWGLAEDLCKRADYRLAPIDLDTGYNHLSVRSAASIVLDRLLGQK